MDGRYSVRDLVDLDRLRRILESFSRATGFTTGFVAHPSMEILIATGWRDICTKFHRVCEASARHCKKSNRSLTNRLHRLKELNIEPCGNGLVDGATPVVVKGVHIASLSTGQAFFEKPDLARFRRQARRYGYDEKAYLEAVSGVPVVSRAQFKSALSFLSDIAVMLADLGLRKLQAEERANDLLKADEKLQSLNAELEQRASRLRRLASDLTLVEQRERRRLAAVMHDHLLQSLAAARIGVSNLRRRCRDDGARTALDRIEQQLDDGISTARTLTADLSPAVLYDSGLVEAVRRLAAVMKDRYGLSVNVRASGQLKVDPAGACVMIHQSLRELLFNVVKHARTDRADVRIALEKGGTLVVDVEDHGAGFQPVKREGAKTGTGMGLFAIRERLEALGGRLEIDSRPGRGTHVRMRIAYHRPVARSLPGAAPAAAPAPHRSGNGVIRILLVDDSPIVRQGLKALLHNERDMTVISEATDGREAVELSRRQCPDVVLMDARMPVMDGIEATRRIAAAQPGVRVIGLSMHGEANGGSTMREAGARAFICKEDAVRTLASVIRAAMSDRKPGDGRPARGDGNREDDRRAI